MTAASLSPRSRWIPWAFAGGFAVVFSANAVMVTFAMSSWTGLETDDAYRKGLAYNRVLEAERREAALGWQGAVRLDQGTLLVALTDARGEPVTAARVRAEFVRPTAEGHDFSVQMVERGGGRYAAAVEPPLPGLWDVRAVVHRGVDEYRIDQRVVVAP